MSERDCPYCKVALRGRGAARIIVGVVQLGQSGHKAGETSINQLTKYAYWLLLITNCNTMVESSVKATMAIIFTPLLIKLKQIYLSPS